MPLPEAVAEVLLVWDSVTAAAAGSMLDAEVMIIRG
jgi:hypothetical protein